MPSSDRIIGFSTGAIAKGDFRRAVAVLEHAHVRVIELSALREHELPDLVRYLPALDRSGFNYISVHAPTNFQDLQECDVIALLQSIASTRLPVVVHPDAIRCFELWKPFGGRLLVENMDKRKPVGRSASELQVVFDKLPEAGLCFDVAHARQVDPSMIESAQILKSFGDRLRQVHASGVTTRSFHGLISAAASSAFGSIAHLIPNSVPIILESPVDESMIQAEIDFARDAFSPWFERLRAEIDDVLDLKVEMLRKAQAASFFNILRTTCVRFSDFESVIGHLPTSAAFASGDMLFNARDLLTKLSEDQKVQLKHHLFHRFKQLAREYPDLRSEFHEQFAGVE
jgi:hypothetical protein